MSLGLPPVSIGLKSIAPYLQRAEELVEREPIVAYWCAYYAAQLGIPLNTQDPNSRNLLLNLLGALERLKKEIGPNDAIDIEPASAAYVENFALKVFKMADDEDRAGNASKSTAKKFVAAGSFFEVLRVFRETDVSDSSEGKLKYAKWKAADIVKAFREGRRPTPGPAGSQLDPEMTIPPPQFPPFDELESQPQPPSPPKPTPREPSPPTKSSRSPKRKSPPPSIPPDDIARANQLPILPGKHDDEALSPGRWSTTATPGFDLARTPGLNEVGSSGGSSDSLNNWHEHVVDPMSRAAAKSSSSSKLKTAWVSTEMEGALSDEEPVEDPVLYGASSVRFSPPGAPTILVEPSPPRLATQLPPSGSPPFHAQEHPSSPPRVSELPPGFVPTGPPASGSGTGPGIHGSPPNVPLFLVPPPPPPPMPHSAPTYGVPPSPPSPPVHVLPSAPPVSTLTPFPAVDSIRVTARPPTRPVELTPSIIAKAQKHCRFAISALDYEDAAHAIRELKDALRLLEGGMGEY